MVETFHPADRKYNTHRTRKEKRAERQEKGTVANNTSKTTDNAPRKRKTRNGIKKGR